MCKKKKKKRGAVLGTLALPYLLSLFPFFPKERKKTKTTAQNRNCVKGSSLRQVPTGSSKGTRAKLIVGSESGPALCSPPLPRSSPPRQGVRQQTHTPSQQGKGNQHMEIKGTRWRTQNTMIFRSLPPVLG